MLYDDKYENVQSWGFSALNIIRKKKTEEKGKLFKLLLGKMENELPLPYEKAITDHLHELGKIIRQTICSNWRDINFHTEVLIILTVNKFRNL